MDREGLIADAKEAMIPDYVWEMVKCAACGCVIPRDEAEPIDGKRLCANCAPEYRRIHHINAKWDGEL